MNSMETVRTLLNDAIESLGGQDNALEACDRMYSQMFISKPYTLAEYVSEVGCFDLDMLKESLLEDLAVKLYTASLTNKSNVPSYPEDDEIESYYESLSYFSETACGWFKRTFPDFEINESTLLVDLCNYKGEGESDEPVLYACYKTLPFFLGKNESFNIANNF